MSSKKSKKKNQKNQQRKSNGSLGEFVKNNWGKLLTFFTTALVAGVAWYFSTCLSDRKDVIKDFRQAALSSRLIEEKYGQEVIALGQQINSLVGYLEGTKIDLAEIREREDQIASLAQLANNDCNASKEALYKYRASREIVAREYFLAKPVWPEMPFEECGGLTEMSQKAVMPNPQRLVEDADYRNRYIQGEKRFFDTNRATFEKIKQVQPERVQFDAELLTQIEMRNSSITKSLWDCFRHLCGIWGG